MSSALDRWTLPRNPGKLQDMSSNADRLAAAVRGRRLDLDRTQLDVWQAGGPSNTTLTRVENSEIETLTRTTARKLDKGLRWEEGSARRVWDGRGEPSPLPELGVDLESLLAELNTNAAGFSKENLDYMRARIEADIAARDAADHTSGSA